MLRMEEQPPIWMVAANILNKLQQKAGKGWYSSWELGELLTTHDRKKKKQPCYETFAIASDLTGGGLL